jgi:HEAT repeat protein
VKTIREVPRDNSRTYPDPAESVRDAAVFRLSRMQSEADVVVPAMVGLFDDESAKIRCGAVLAIRRMSNQGYDAGSVVGAVAEKLDDESPQVRSNAIGLLSSITPDSSLVRPLLTSVGGDTSDFVRASAAGSIGKLGMGSEEIMAALVAALDDASPKVSRGAIKSLETLAEHSFGAARALVRALDHENEEVPADVARRLGRVEVSRAAAGAAREHKFPSDVVVEALTELLDDAHPHVWTSAAAALRELGGMP